jgi:TetR/AcrR family fatty acid metabolism transcriptional regulator
VPDCNDKRDRILKTAVKLFGREGYYGTRMSEVARQAKVSPKTLYKCFSGKKSLFMAARDAAIDRMVREIISGAPPAGEADSFTIIKDLLNSYSDFIRRNRGLARILAEAVAIVDDDIRGAQLEAFNNGAVAIALLIESDERDGRLRLVTDPEKTAWLFLSFAALLAYAVLLDLDRKSGGGFDPAYALDAFFAVMRAD